jgi:hypothetical protein
MSDCSFWNAILNVFNSPVTVAIVVSAPIAIIQIWINAANAKFERNFEAVLSYLDSYKSCDLLITELKVALISGKTMTLAPELHREDPAFEMCTSRKEYVLLWLKKLQFALRTNQVKHNEKSDFLLGPEAFNISFGLSIQMRELADEIDYLIKEVQELDDNFVGEWTTSLAFFQSIVYPNSHFNVKLDELDKRVKRLAKKALNSWIVRPAKFKSYPAKKNAKTTQKIKTQKMG